MDRKFFTALLLAAVVGGLIYLVYLVFQPFLISMLWASVLAIVTYPAYRQMVGLLRGHRTVAAAIMTGLVLILLVGPFVSLTLLVVQDAMVLADDLEPETLEAKARSALEQPWAKRAVAKVHHYLNEDVTPQMVAEFAKRNILPVLSRVGDVIFFLVNLVLGIAIMLLAIFFFYRDGPAAVRALRELVPMPDADRDAILNDIQGAINAAVRGGLLTAFVQGLLGYIILFILGVESDLLFAVAIALASLIPIVGTAVVWGPLALYMGFVEGQVARALVLAGYGAIVIGSADNFLRPLLVGRHMKAHPLILFFGTLGGIAEFGFPGIVLGPVVVALLNVTTRLFRREFSAAAAG